MSAAAVVQLSFVLQALEQLPKLIEAGIEVKDIIVDTTATVKAMRAEERAPTEEEWAELNGRVDRLRAQLHEGGAPTG